MRLFGYELNGFAKALVILAAVFLVATGLCGMQLAASAGGQKAVALFLPIGIAAGVAILLSGMGIVVVLIAWGISVLFRRSGQNERRSEAGGGTINLLQKET